MTVQINPVFLAAAEAWRPQSGLNPWQFADAHVYSEPGSPMPGRFRSENSPWLREPLEEYANNRRKNVVVMCSAQSSKSTLAVLGLMWSIAEDPGRAMWVTSDIDMAKDDLRDRYLPMFQRCEPVRRQILTEEVENVIFRTMPLYFRGARSPGKLQSKPIRWLILDEVRNYPSNALPTVLKRTRAFWNCRRLMVSTPGNEFQNIHHHYLQGDQRVWHQSCPICSAVFEMKFEELRASHPDFKEVIRFRDVPGAFAANGEFLGDVAAPFIRYVCPGCGGLIEDKPVHRKAMARNGRFVVTNPGAPEDTVSFTWSALVPFWVSWKSVVQEYFDALFALKNGDVEPMRTFVTETEGRPWRDELGEIEDFGFLADRQDDYELGDPWGDEAVRFMSADRQAEGGEHYFWIVRAFSSKGRSRLIAYGRANSVLELEEKRAEHNVPKDNAALDSGHKATEVYRFCLANRWKPFKGDKEEWYVVRNKRTGRPYRRSWDVSIVDAAMGKGGLRRMLRLYRHSVPTVRDFMGSVMGGTVPGWTLPRRLERSYFRHLSAHVREEIKDTLGRPKLVWRQRWNDDHWLDCEMIIQVMAMICRLVSGPERGDKPTVLANSSDTARPGPDVPPAGDG